LKRFSSYLDIDNHFQLIYTMLRFPSQVFLLFFQKMKGRPELAGTALSSMNAPGERTIH